LQSLFHHDLDHLVMLTNFENLFQRSATIKVNSLITYSSILQLMILVIAIEHNLFLSLLTNYFSLSLFLIINCFFSWINSSSRIIDTNKGAWSDRLWRSGEIMWLLNSSDPIQRNIRFSTEFKSWKLSAYWVNTRLMNVNSSKLKLSATFQSVSIYNEWWGYDRSQLLSLMLKSSIMIRTLFKFYLSIL